MKESENNFDDARIEKIKKDLNKLRDRLSKSKLTKIRKDLYRIGNKKNLSAQKIKEIEKVFLNLRSIVIMMILNTEV